MEIMLILGVARSIPVELVLKEGMVLRCFSGRGPG